MKFNLNLHTNGDSGGGTQGYFKLKINSQKLSWSFYFTLIVCLIAQFQVKPIYSKFYLNLINLKFLWFTNCVFALIKAYS